MTTTTKGETVTTSSAASRAKPFTMPTTFKSLSDIGYQAARYQDTGSLLIKALVEQDIGWPDKVSDDNMALLRSGVALRKAEITPDQWYKVEGKNYIGPATEAPPKGDRKDWLLFNNALASGYTPHQLGELKESDPALHKLVSERRAEISKYVSNCIGRLKAMTKAMQTGERARGATMLIKDKVDKFFKDLMQSNKLARDNRGDPTAFDDDLLKRKIAAFHAAK